MDEATVSLVAIVIIPVLFVSLFYFAMALMVWPYARPIIPFGLLLLFVLFPPLFPFLLLYLFFVFAFRPVHSHETVVVRGVIVEPSTRGRIRTVSTSVVGTRGNRV